MLNNFDFGWAGDSVNLKQVSYEIDEENDEDYDFYAANYIVILDESKCEAKRLVNPILFDTTKLIKEDIWVVGGVSQGLERTKEKITIAYFIYVEDEDQLKNM